MKQWIFVGMLAVGGCMGPERPADKDAAPFRPKAAGPVIPPPPPAPVGVEVNSGLRQAAKQELANALSSSDPLVRMHAIEAAKEVLGSGAREVILTGLKDPEPAVNFAAAVAAGELKLEEAA